MKLEEITAKALAYVRKYCSMLEPYLDDIIRLARELLPKYQADIEKAAKGVTVTVERVETKKTPTPEELVTGGE